MSEGEPAGLAVLGAKAYLEAVPVSSESGRKGSYQKSLERSGRGRARRLEKCRAGVGSAVPGRGLLVGEVRGDEHSAILGSESEVVPAISIEVSGATERLACANLAGLPTCKRDIHIEETAASPEPSIRASKQNVAETP